MMVAEAPEITGWEKVVFQTVPSVITGIGIVVLSVVRQLMRY